MRDSLFERVAHDLISPSGRRDPRRAFLVLADLVTLIMGLAAMATLVGRYGFYLDPRLEGLAEDVSRWILYGFLGLTGLKVLVTPRRREYARVHIAELALVGLCVLILLFPGQIGGALERWNPVLTPDGMASLFVAVTQVALLAALLPGAFRASRRLMTLPLQPALLIVLSFLALIALGTGALLLPRATSGRPLTFLEALFTATSAACVTGLTVVDTGTAFAPLGRWVLLVLMQAGGLGIMTLTTFFAVFVGRRGSLKEYATLQAILGQDSIGRIRGAAGQIALSTLAVEMAGAVALYIAVGPGRDDRVFFAVFHAVSAFCNAGFSLLTQGLADPLFRSRPAALITIMALIVLGGLGFAVLRNIAVSLLTRFRRQRRAPLTLHTRLVLVVTVSLLALGALAFGFLEREGSLSGEATGGVVLHALFQSVTARTAGFNTVDMAAISAPTAMVIMILMWVGASPGSTGGGVKTTSFALVLLDAYSVARGRGRVQVGRTPVDPTSVARAHATVTLSLALVAAGFLALVITERSGFLAIAFETISAAGTVGLSMGATYGLSDAGKIVVTILMFVGRVGFLTLAMAVTRRDRPARVDYGAENVAVL